MAAAAAKQGTISDAGITLVRELTGCYQEQLTAYRQLAHASQEHRTLLQGGIYDDLTERLERQAGIMAEIDTLQTRIGELQQGLAGETGFPEPTVEQLQSWAKAGSAADSQAVAKLGRVITEIGNTVRDLQGLVEENERTLREHLQGLRGDISQLKQGRTAFKAYARELKGDDGESRFVNRTR